MMLHQKEYLPLWPWLRQNYPDVHLHHVFATDLKPFIAHCPASWELNARQLVQNSCILPIYSPFVSPEARETQLRWSQRKTTEFPPLRSLAKAAMPRSVFRACRECVRHDLDEFEEPYLHREHHLPAIDVCLRHASRLIDVGNHMTCAPALWKALRAVGKLPESNVRVSGSSLLAPLGERVEQLLARPINENEDLDLWPLYRWRLREMGMKNSEIAPNLVSRLLEKYGPVSQYIHIKSWSDAGLKRFRSGRTKFLTPVAHLILQEFCGLSLDDTLKFGARGLVPCLSPFCAFDTPKLIRSGEQTYQTHCPRCGFIASFKPTGALGEKVRYLSILRRGPLFEKAVKKMFRQGLSVEEIAETINRSKASVHEILKAVGCKAVLPGKELRNLSEEARYAREQGLLLKRRNAYRTRLLEFLKKHPQATRTKMNHSIQSTVRWLFRHDLAWYEKKMPPSRTADHFLNADASQRGVAARQRKRLENKKS